MGLLNFLRKHYIAVSLAALVVFMLQHRSPSEENSSQNGTASYRISKSEKFSNYNDQLQNQDMHVVNAEPVNLDTEQESTAFNYKNYEAQKGEFKDSSTTLHLDCTCKTGMRRAMEETEDGLQSYCSPYSTARGENQKIFSFSGYRTNIKAFKTNFLHSIKVIRKEMPGWIIRLYVSLPDQQLEGEKDFLCELFCDHPYVDICNINRLPTPFIEEGNYRKVKALTRLIPFFDPLVDVFNPRDIGSYSTNRELTSVKEWLSSNKTFHVMRDSPRHNFVMMGGMWGMKTSADRELSKILGKRILVNPFGYQSEEKMLLMTYVWPKAKGDAMCHDSYHCLFKYYKCSEMRTYSVERIGGETVGHNLGTNVAANPSLSYECPLGCRPKNHKNWRYC